ncbi:MAG: DeoR/GlpR transcriptional regulator [Chloroflexi bacterium]|nr:DeoR/GlpR transcriptional regulator [Chloroflexota bacterium]
MAAEHTERPGPKSLLMRDRRGRIVDLVRQRGTVLVSELAEQFGVSAVTIRTDLEQLEQDGFLLRDRGGAVAPEQRSGLIAFEQRKSLAQDAKARIGRAAAGLVSPGDTIILDAGTTTVQMTPYLRTLGPLTVITNALNVAMEFRGVPDVRVVLLGGSLNFDTLSTHGILAEQGLDAVVVQKLFLGAQSVELQAGVTETSPEIARVKRAMVHAARQVILLADAQKWSRTGFIKVTPLSSIQTVVTDDALPDDARAAIEKAGAELILA